LTLIYLTSALMLILSVALMQWRFGLFSIIQLNVLQVMFVSHVLSQFLPSFIMVLNAENVAGPTYFLYCGISLILIPLGGLLADAILQVRPNAFFYSAPMRNDFLFRRKFTRFFLLYFVFCLVIFLTYVSQVPTMPIYDLIFGVSDVTGHQVARREASSMGLLYGMALRFFMPVLFLMGLMSRGYFVGSSLRSLGLMAMIVAVLYNAWPGSKTPVATLFLMATFVLLIRASEMLPKRDGEAAEVARMRQIINRKRAVRFAVIVAVLAFLYPVGVFLMLPAGEQGIGYVLESVFLRVFFKPAENTYAAFELFMNGGFTYFSDISKFSHLMGGQYVSLSQLVASHRGLGDLTNAPPAAIGNFYAQGGGLIVVIGVLVASFLFKFTENILRQYATKSPLVIALYTTIIFGAFRFSWANFHNLLFSEVFMPMVIIAIFWIVISGSRKTEINPGGFSSEMQDNQRFK